MRRAALVATVMLARWAHAETPAVDVADLPPLPAPTEEESATASVLAASSVEEDVVVGAAKREQSLGNVASAVTVVSGDRLRRFGYRTVGEAVAAVAGVYLVDNRLSYSIGIRGLQIPGDYNTRILVLVDGASINEGWAAFAGLGLDNFVPIDEVARIEVIRGPVSSVYGANAFFGIVNIVTRGAAETPKAWGRTAINEINGSITSAGFAQGGLHRQLRGTVQLVDRFGETTSVPEVGSGLGGDSSRAYAASLVGSYGGSFAQVRAYRYWRDSPFAPYNGDTTAAHPYTTTDTQLLVEGGHTREIGKLTLSARGYANLYEYKDHIIQQSDAPFDDLGQGKSYGLELRGRYDLGHTLGLTAGTEATYYQTYSKSYTEGDETCADGHAACVPKDFNIEGVYSEVDGQPLPWLGFTGGLRFDNNSVIDRRLSPRAALFVAKPEKYGVKLLYAEGFRNPSAYEAFFYDNTSFSQPTHIQAETIRSFETVLWAKPTPGLSTRFSAFYWDARNVVEQLPDPMNAALLQFQNAGRFVSEGVEVEGSYRTARGWYGFAGATYANVGCAQCGAFMTDPASTKLELGHVPNAPALTGSAGVSTPAIGGLAHLSTELVYIGERPTRPDVDTGAESPASPQWFDWNWTLYVPNIHGFDVTAGVRNLIGKRDLVVAPGDYDRFDGTSTTTVPRVPGEGREVYVKVGYSY
jgi:iron complex outermembrane receptor protein